MFSKNDFYLNSKVVMPYIFYIIQDRGKMLPYFGTIKGLALILFNRYHIIFNHSFSSIPITFELCIIDKVGSILSNQTFSHQTHRNQYNLHINQH